MLEIQNICKSYRLSRYLKGGKREVLRNVSFSIANGECVGLVGESGSGKSSLARIISGIDKPDSGQVLINGKDAKKRNNRLNQISIVFQDYTSSINPTKTVYEVISEPILISSYLPKAKVADAVNALLGKVDLSIEYANYYLSELSGGQAQRVCIARAIASNPKFIIFDEAISSLDLPVQVKILDLLRKIRNEFDIGFLFITHDIQTLCYLSDSVIFFDGGEIVETCNIIELRNVKHNYSKALLNAVTQNSRAK